MDINSILDIDKTISRELFLDCTYYFEVLPKIKDYICLLYTAPSPRDGLLSRMPSSA